MTLLRAVEVEGAVVDVRVGRTIEGIGSLSRRRGEQVIDGRGGALIPGLHDHHIHLLALAAADESVDVTDGLQALKDLPGEGWLRAVGWAEEGDRHTLDRVVPHRALRVQHRSGAVWVVNTRGLALLDLKGAPGVERDEDGHPTGRLWRADGWLGIQIGRDAPDLARLSRRMLGLGLTGVTDATPSLDAETCALLRTSVPLNLQLLGEGTAGGPYKLVLADHELPTYEELVQALSTIRPRPVAVHCVTREALVLVLAVLREVGRVHGDRIEHGSLIPAALVAGLPLVVTQPGFLLARGDDYLQSVDGRDLPDLYRYRSLLAAGTCVVPSSDAPYGPLDPWAILRCARDRASKSGRVLQPEEAVTPQVALDGMLRPLIDPTAPARTVVRDAPADLVLLDSPLDEVLHDPDSERVVATLLGGEVVHVT